MAHDAKTVLVLGGTGSIGQSVCRSLAASGYDIHFTYGRKLEVAKCLAREIEKIGRHASYHQEILGSPNALEALEKVVFDLPALSGAVYASGPDLAQPFISQVEAEKWGEIFQQDTLSFLAFARLVVARFRSLGGGALIAVTTAAAMRHADRDGLSSIPKAAVEAAVRGIAREEGRYGIRANCVAPGMLDVGLGQRIISNHFSPEIAERIKVSIPLRSFGNAEDISAAVEFLMSPNARYITGQVLRVDGGWSV